MVLCGVSAVLATLTPVSGTVWKLATYRTHLWCMNQASKPYTRFAALQASKRRNAETCLALKKASETVM